MEIVHYTQKIILKHFFPKFFNILTLWRHLDPKIVLFEHFEQIFADFDAFLDYNMEITP